MRAAGIGGSIMGRGANLLILDDYFKNVEEALSETTRRKHHQWYHSTFKTRGTPDCSILIIATRWHKKDLIGLLLEEQERGGDQWEVINLPAIAEEDDQLGRQPGEALWPEQWPLAALEQKRNSYVASGYEWQWEALYQQNPPETLDAEYPKEYFEGDLFFDEWPTKLAIKTMALDPSVGKTAKSDYSAIVQLGVSPDGLLYVDADLQRRDVFRTASDAIDICRPFSPVAFGVETIAFQQVLSPIIAERSKAAGFMLPLYEINHHHQDKKSRIRARLTPYLAKRQFRFKRHSPGVNLLLEQLKGFPATKYDDGPDALEMAVRLAQDMWANQPAEQEYYEYERVLC